MTNAERQRKYREKRNAERNVLIKNVTEIVTKTGESVTVGVTECPSGVDAREWRYACERAGRARKYAEMFPQHVRPSEVRYQDPMWQWENEVRGRFTSPVGGSLSGTRG